MVGLNQLTARLTDIQTVPQAAPSALGSPPPAAIPTREPWVSPLKRYDGHLRQCKTFLLQCGPVFDLQSLMYSTEKTKIAYLISLLRGEALEWASVHWRRQDPVTSTYANFTQEMSKVFDHPVQGKDAARRLFSLRQGSQSVAEYSIEFRTLVAESGWNEAALLSVFVHGLSERRQDPVTSTYANFTQEMSKVFDHPVQGKDAARRLFSLRQGSQSVAEYSIEFRTLVAESGWNEAALLSVFVHGLSERMQMHFALNKEVVRTAAKQNISLTMETSSFYGFFNLKLWNGTKPGIFPLLNQNQLKTFNHSLHRFDYSYFTVLVEAPRGRLECLCVTGPSDSAGVKNTVLLRFSAVPPYCAQVCLIFQPLAQSGPISITAPFRMGKENGPFHHCNAPVIHFFIYRFTR
ncbi:hypothetical protein F2P81_002303 [Scophthalmus maximus]|uniref:Retrotransposon gag domain-containing protein n=1 Tax=Scophthalmus maximus TaxID=52904 RepID=A0A6A4TRB8_SCOMX|nr:hypothetical protein F2P81_002303 [Scophthalmus maximus]